MVRLVRGGAADAEKELFRVVPLHIGSRSFDFVPKHFSLHEKRKRNDDKTLPFLQISLRLQPEQLGILAALGNELLVGAQFEQLAVFEE